MTIKSPPIYEPLSNDPNGVASLPWILFFNQIYTGDKGLDWSPLFTSLTVVGAAPTITGRVYKISQSIAFFRIKIVPGTNTSSTAGTTFVNNFPLIMNADGVCFAVSGLLGTNSGMCDQSSNGIYVPTWTAVTVPLTIIGMVEAS